MLFGVVSKDFNAFWYTYPKVLVFKGFDMLPVAVTVKLKGENVTQVDWFTVEGLQYQTLSKLVSLLNS